MMKRIGRRDKRYGEQGGIELEKMCGKGKKRGGNGSEEKIRQDQKNNK